MPKQTDSVGEKPLVFGTFYPKNMPFRPGSDSPPVDRLSSLLERFRLRAHLFHAGALCGVTHFAAQPGRGFLHVLRSGEMVVTHKGRAGVKRTLKVTEPTLLFYPRPLSHNFHNAPVEGSDFVCATLDFEGGENHPLVRALPPLLALPLRDAPELEHTLLLLFSETERVRCGQRLLANRLFEVLVLQLLRWVLDHSAQADLPPGLLTGLAEPRLARALVAIHERPADNWTLETMARQAGMSRSVFASAFRQRVGQPPADYLTRWRVSIGQGLLRDGVAVKVVARQLGYGSASSFSRAFAQAVGEAPRTWVRSERA